MLWPFGVPIAVENWRGGKRDCLSALQGLPPGGDRKVGVKPARKAVVVPFPAGVVVSQSASKNNNFRW